MHVQLPLRLLVYSLHNSLLVSDPTWAPYSKVLSRLGLPLFASVPSLGYAPWDIACNLSAISHGHTCPCPLCALPGQFSIGVDLALTGIPTEISPCLGASDLNTQIFYFNMVASLFTLTLTYSPTNSPCWLILAPFSRPLHSYCSCTELPEGWDVI